MTTGSKLIIAEDLGLAANELNLAKQVAEALEREYPGYAWCVNVNRSMVDVRALRLDGEWGFGMHVPGTGFYSASAMEAKAKRLAGELLERFGQRRGRINLSALEAERRDFAGRLPFDR